MKILLLLILVLSNIFILSGQNSFKAIIRDKDTREPLVGATVFIKGTTLGNTAGADGVVQINNIPDGIWPVVYRFVGYKELTDTVLFPAAPTKVFEIYLIAEQEEMEEVVITATRSSRTISDIPTRIEAISGEELEEKGNMKPGDIRMMLNESTGIQTQQTSATSYNSSIRIQGLDGKYTQILKDGYPLYSGFSGGLGLLQIVPLDLKQVEVIKGASSTLYGGGAIAGLVNLVSKLPGPERKLDFMLNGTSALGLDASGFYSQKFSGLGTTVFVSYNSGNAYDPSNIGLTAIPEFKRVTVNPRLFLYLGNKTTADIGVNSTLEDRTGGDIRYIEGKGDDIHSYFEKNKTNRFSMQLGVSHTINQNSNFKIKNSESYYNRKISVPGFIFAGTQYSSFTEVSYALKKSNHELIAGLNLWTEQFTQDKNDTAPTVNYSHVTYGAFIQDTWELTRFLALETGIRADYQLDYGLFSLPRISALLKFNKNFSARIGGGMGYKTPTVFTEDAERIQFRNVLPIDKSEVKAEQSTGGNLDINYRTLIRENLSLSFNTLFFYTKITRPLILSAIGNNFYEFRQPSGFIDTKGIETNIKLTYNDIKLFIGYTLADVKHRQNGASAAFPLVAKHRLNNVLMYEIEDKLKVGLEAYYYSKQKLNDGSTGKPYWLNGVMAEKLWEHFSLFVNFENIFDVRQTKFDTIYTGSISNPVFRDIYAPVDGFLVNGGIKVKL